MSDDRQQASFDPTPQRIRRAEQGGQFARSPELATALAWTGGIAVLAIFGSTIWQAMQQLATENLSQVDVSIESKSVFQNQFGLATSLFWKALLPVLAGFAAVAVLAHSGQIGFRFMPHLAAPKLSRISPIHNAGQLFSRQQMTTVALGLLKLVLLMAVAAWILLGDLKGLLLVGNLSAEPGDSVAGATFCNWLINAAIRLCVASVLIGMLDFGIRWRIHRSSLRMTEQEVRDEQRSMEPSSEVTSRRRLMSSR